MAEAHFSYFSTLWMRTSYSSICFSVIETGSFFAGRTTFLCPTATSFITLLSKQATCFREETSQQIFKKVLGKYYQNVSEFVSLLNR